MLVDTSSFPSHPRQTLQAILRNLTARSGTVFMEAGNVLESTCREERCPVRVQFEYSRGMKTKMEVVVSKEAKRNTFVRVRVRDEYSIVKEVEEVIGEVLRQEGAMVEVQRVEA